MARNIDNKYENMFRWMSNKLRIQDRFIRNNISLVQITPSGNVYLLSLPAHDFSKSLLCL